MGREIAADGIKQAREDFATDRLSVDALDAETEFWLSVEDCDRCSTDQMCTSHFDRFYSGSTE